MKSPLSLAPDVDVIVLAGGRARRLGGVDKASMRVGARTLLGYIMDQLGPQRAIAVVGPQKLASLEHGALFGDDFAHRVLTREVPDFGGPAAGIASGVAALGNRRVRGNFTAILPVDAPWAPAALPELLAALTSEEHGPEIHGPELAVAVDAGGREQWLTCVARSDALARRVEAAGELDGTSALKLLAPLKTRFVTMTQPAKAQLVLDIDTPEDARRLGVSLPPS